MVNPGGTGNPMRHISPRFAPLAPSSAFIVPLPSVLRPNRSTYLPEEVDVRRATSEVRFAVTREVAFLTDEGDCFRASFLAITIALLLRFPRYLPARESAARDVSSTTAAPS